MLRLIDHDETLTSAALANKGLFALSFKQQTVEKAHQ